MWAYRWRKGRRNEAGTSHNEPRLLSSFIFTFSFFLGLTTHPELNAHAAKHATKQRNQPQPDYCNHNPRLQPQPDDCSHNPMIATTTRRLPNPTITTTTHPAAPVRSQPVTSNRMWATFSMLGGGI